MEKLKHIATRIAHGLFHCEQPFHLTYLGAAARYYFEHDLTLALASGGLFTVILAAYVAELIGGDNA